MGWISDLVGGTVDVSPIVVKVARVFDYLVGDLKGCLMCGFFAWAVMVQVNNQRFVSEVKSKWVTPREHEALNLKLQVKESQVDSFYRASVSSAAFFNNEALRFADLIRKKDSLIQEKNFIIANYERAVKNSIK